MKNKNDEPYSNMILSLRSKHTKNKNLSKAMSNNILINVCPYCDKCIECQQKNGHPDSVWQICLWKSSTFETVWIRVTPDRPKINIGLTYGKITPIKYKYTDDYGNLFYECIVGDNENTQLIRSQEILRGRKPIYIEEKKKKRYHRGSSMNPDGTRHVLPMEHHSKVGQTVDELVIEERDFNDGNGTIIVKYHKRKLCDECGGLVKTNAHGEPECERCSLIQ
jgi:hypothetical protein